MPPRASRARKPLASPPPVGEDLELDAVEAWMLAQDDVAARFGDAFRQSFDEVLDGQRTGRWDTRLLSPTEKNYIGTKVENVCRAAFGLSNGTLLDYEIAGVEVDSKFSHDYRSPSWMIPPSTYGRLCLVMKASDEHSVFAVGLLRTHLHLLGRGKGNRDTKRGILAEGRDQIRWLFLAEPMPKNLLLDLDPNVRDLIFREKGRGNGQMRVNELFRQVQGTIIRREVTLTVGEQDDPMKRARDARKKLRPEGVLVLGHTAKHRAICEDLGVDAAPSGSHISVRVTTTPRGQRRSTTVDGTQYFKAEAGDPTTPAPPSY